jgi:hypothetical protein
MCQVASNFFLVNAQCTELQEPTSNERNRDDYLLLVVVTVAGSACYTMEKLCKSHKA